VYIVWAFKSGYVAEFYDDAHSWIGATQLTVRANESITGINFALTPQPRGPFVITGRVVGTDGQPLAGALVVLRQGDQLVASAVSEEDGGYVLDELPCGDYTVSATLPVREGSLYAPLCSQPLTLSGGATWAEQSTGELVLSPANGTDSELPKVPETFALVGNFPNPFNPSTEIRFDLPEAAEVSITIFNLLGRPVRTLMQGTLSAGRHAVLWDGRDVRGARVASGLYICRLEAQAASGGRHLFLHKMLLTQ
jgi:hypothetical protein